MQISEYQEKISDFINTNSPNCSYVFFSEQPLVMMSNQNSILIPTIGTKPNIIRRLWAHLYYWITSWYTGNSFYLNTARNFERLATESINYFPDKTQEVQQKIVQLFQKIWGKLNEEDKNHLPNLKELFLPSSKRFKPSRIQIGKKNKDEDQDEKFEYQTENDTAPKDILPGTLWLSPHPSPTSSPRKKVSLSSDSDTREETIFHNEVSDNDYFSSPESFPIANISVETEDDDLP